MSQTIVKTERVLAEFGFALVFLLLSLLIVASWPHLRVSAHNGFQGAWEGGSTVRWYYYGTADTYIDQLAAADDDWNYGQLIITFLHTTNSSWRNIAVKDVHAGDDWYAQVVGFGCGCVYSVVPRAS